jgi:hypothetical protein
MGQFLYYLPGRQAVSDDEAGKLLPHAELLPAYSKRQIGAGPDGAGGMLLCRGEAPEHFIYDPETQVWQSCESGAWWVGYEKEAMPGPEDLLRADAIEGHLVKLFDGHDWIIPILRVITTGTVLPMHTAIVLGANGQWITKLRPQYQTLGHRVEALWNDFYGGLKAAAEGESPLAITFDLKMELVIEALAINYRISGAEISLLMLLGGVQMNAVIEAMLDYPTALSMAQKKTSIESGSISSGAME